MLTRHGVCYNLKNSPYVCHTETSAFFFSSAMYLQKFEHEYKDHRKKIADSLSLRFNVRVSFDSVADLVLYSKIEKRGFYMMYKGVEYECRESLKYHGDNPSRTS